MNGEMTAFKRFYTPIVKRCDELEKKLKFFQDELKAANIVRRTCHPVAQRESGLRIAAALPFFAFRSQAVACLLRAPARPRSLPRPSTLF